MTKLRQVRIEQGLEAHEVCKAANLSRPNLCTLELARTKAGSVVRARVAGALGVSAKELFDGDGWPIEVAEGQQNSVQMSGPEAHSKDVAARQAAAHLEARSGGLQ